MKAYATYINSYGDTSVLEYSEIKLDPPKPNEVQIRQHYSGVNYADIYFRQGIYKFPALPGILGIEGMGTIEALGDEVTSFKKGQRIAYAGLPVGSYTSVRNLAVEKTILLPDAVTDKDAASIMLRGITAHMLLTENYAFKSGDIILVQAAAGGLGLVLTQWIKALGGHVIGTVGSIEKANLVKKYGIDHVILYHDEDVVTAVNRFTNGKGVDYAIDGIGGATLMQSAKVVRHGGTLASIGQVAGPVNETAINSICAANSIQFVRPSVMAYMKDQTNYIHGAEAAIRQLQNGLQIIIDAIFPLNQAARAHQRLETRKTIGSLLLDTSV